MDDGMEGMMDEGEAPMMKDGKRPMTEENTPEGNGETMHVPLEFLQGTKFKEGDELVLKVVSAGDDGLEVAYAKAPPSEGSNNSAHAELDQLGQAYQD